VFSFYCCLVDISFKTVVNCVYAASAEKKIIGCQCHTDKRNVFAVLGNWLPVAPTP